jgi:hypothetical protein
MTAGPYAAAYETYRRAGWNGTLPLPPRRKSSPPKDTTGEGGAWPSVADCMAWADGPEGAGNIALRLPHDVIGLDVDAYDGKLGAWSLTAAEQRYGPLPATWCTTARGDGVSGIRLYRVPEGLAWPGEVGPACEIIQHRHRYAVVWPSVHPGGPTYQWYGPDGQPSGIPDPDQLPALPQAWVDGLTGGREHQATPRNNWTTTQIQHWLITRPRALDAPCPRMKRAVDAARLALAAGTSAHDTTIGAVMRAVRLADEGHAGAVPALGQLHAAFMTEATRPGRPGHTRSVSQAENEWRRALDGAVSKVSATTTGLDVCDCDGRLTNAIVAAAGTSAHTTQPDPAQPSQPGSVHDPQPGQTLPDIVEDQIRTATLKLKIQEEARRRLRREQNLAQEPPELTPLADFLAVPDEPQRYRVENLWPVGGRVMLAAQFKSGKTTIVGNLTRALADGEAFLESFLTHAPAGQIVIIDDELDERMLRRWLRDQGIKNTDRVTVLSLRGRLSTFDLIDPDIREQWAAKLHDVDAALVILDCLAPILDALGLSEDKEAGRFLVALDELAKAAGIDELLLVHHMGHNTERARGASRLRDWPDVEWKLTREKPEEGEDQPAARRFFSAYGRDVDVAESALDYLPEVRRVVLAGGSRRAAENAETEAAVIAYLTANPGSSGRQVEMFAAAPLKKTRKALKDLVAKGQVTAVETSNGNRYSIAAGATGCGKPLAAPKPQVSGQMGEGVRQGAATVRQTSAEGRGKRTPPSEGGPALAAPPDSGTRPPESNQDPDSVDERLARVRARWGEDP